MENNLIVILSLVVVLIVGAAAGYFIRILVALGKKGSMELEIKEISLNAKSEAQQIITEAEEEVKNLLASAKNTADKKVQEAERSAEKIVAEKSFDVQEREKRAQHTEERLIEKEKFLDSRQNNIDRDVEELKHKEAKVQEQIERVKEIETRKLTELEKISGLSQDEAKEKLFQKIEHDAEEDLSVRIKKMEIVGQEQLDAKAREIVTGAIQRYGNSVTSDLFTTHVSIPNDEIKGKIIGKEGRNIKTFERMSGTELIVDETPGAITVSSFDPIRRQIARVALENLILDGRIQPARIEEFIEKAKNEINKIIKDKGEQAAYEVGILNLDPRLIQVLGRLYFRTSYGQNVLQHSIEAAYISGMIAEEIGADVKVAKTAALLHDIGKALDHEVQGTHVEIGIRILQKFGVDEKVVNAMKSHHEDYPYESLEARIVQVADSISATRPGARRDSVEEYLKRLEDLEKIATSFKGIEKAYALSAGREIRLFINPSKMSDVETRELARDIALKIEQELKYPGEIKVTAIRETRVIEFAR